MKQGSVVEGATVPVVSAPAGKEANTVATPVTTGQGAQIAQNAQGVTGPQGAASGIVAAPSTATSASGTGEAVTAGTQGVAGAAASGAAATVNVTEASTSMSAESADVSRFLDVVTVSGAVRYAGPYARTPSLKLSSVVTADQMLETTNLDYAELTRLNADGSHEYKTFAPKDVLGGKYDLALQAKDSIRLVTKTVFGGTAVLPNFDKFGDAVVVSGEVARPDVYALTPKMKLSQVVTANQMLLDTNLNYAEIVRMRADGKNEYYTFRPSEVLAGTWDFELSSRDTVKLVKVGYTPEKPDFDHFADAVMVSGPVQFSGLYAWREGMKLSDVQSLAKPLMEINVVYAVINRPMTGGKTQYITFAPREIDSGIFDIGLNARDTIQYYSTNPVQTNVQVQSTQITPAVSAATTTGMATSALPMTTATQGPTSIGAASTTPTATNSPAPNASVLPVSGIGVLSGTTAPAAAASSGLATVSAPGVASAPGVGGGPVQSTGSGTGAGGITTDLGLSLEIVNVTGVIRYAGPYARTPSLKLSSVVTDDQILQDTNLDYAELTRRTADGGWEYTTFSPREVLSGTFDMPLRAQDSIRFVQVGYLPDKPDFDHFGNAYALVGTVRHTGLYSIRKSTMLSSVISADQIISNTDIYYAEIERWVTGGRTEYMTFSPKAVLVGLQDIRIFPRDIIRLVPAGDNGATYDFSRYPDTVIVKGTVRYPGRYAWYDGIQLSKILSGSDLLIDTDSGYAEIHRRSAESDTILSFTPSDIVQGKNDIVLQPRDTIIFYPKSFNKPVTVSGEVADPKVIPYYDSMELSAVLRSVTPTADFSTLKASVTRIGGGSFDVYLDDYLRSQSGQKVVLQPGDSIALKKLLLDEHLPMVTVHGALKSPQSVEFKEGMKLSDAIAAAGGYDSYAYPVGLVLIRKSAAESQQKQVDRLIAQLDAATAAGAAIPTSTSTGLSSADAVVANLQIELAIQKARLGSLKQMYKDGFGRISLDIPNTLEALASSPANVPLERDDIIYVPKTPTYVLVSGEVADQNIVAYRDGMTVRQALSESGWLSGEADMAHAYILRASGRLTSTEGKGFLFFRPTIMDYTLNPGDTVIVPSRTTKISVGWGYVKDIVDITYKLLMSVLSTKTILGW
jgi:hypothetical protein